MKPDKPLPKGAALIPVILFTSQSNTERTIAANNSENQDVIKKPGVKNAVIANTTKPAINLIKYCPKPDLSLCSTFSIMLSFHLRELLATISGHWELLVITFKQVFTSILTIFLIFIFTIFVII